MSAPYPTVELTGEMEYTHHDTLDAAMSRSVLNMAAVSGAIAIMPSSPLVQDREGGLRPFHTVVRAICTDGKRVTVAYCCGFHGQRADQRHALATIRTLLVREDMRRIGLGRDIVRHLQTVYQEILLAADLEVDRGAESFWANMGFQKSLPVATNTERALGVSPMWWYDAEKITAEQAQAVTRTNDMHRLMEAAFGCITIR